MTLRLYKSQVPANFDAMVQQYLAERLEHQGTINVPAPQAPHPFVEHVVVRVPHAERDRWVADYVLVDDPPRPLKERKKELHAQLAKTEDALLDKIISPGRLRMLHLDVAEACAAPENERTAEQQVKIDQLSKIIKQRQQLHYRIAEIMIQIDDLDESSIDSFELLPLPEFVDVGAHNG